MEASDRMTEAGASCGRHREGERLVDGLRHRRRPHRTRRSQDCAGCERRCEVGLGWLFAECPKKLMLWWVVSATRTETQTQRIATIVSKASNRRTSTIEALCIRSIHHRQWLRFCPDLKFGETDVDRRPAHARNRETYASDCTCWKYHRGSRANVI